MEKKSLDLNQLRLERDYSHKIDWHLYNLAKTDEKRLFIELLYELSQLIPEPPHINGRPPAKVCDLFFSLGLKLYSNYSGRKTISDLRIAQRAGYIFSTPHFNTMNDFLNCPATHELLMKMLNISAMPLKELEDSFSLDSSGFGTYQHERWKRVRYSKDPEKGWKTFLKGHICIGTRTNIIVSCEITNCYGLGVSDAKQAPKLLESLHANFNPKEVSADKAYSSKRIYQIIQAIGAMPFIAFKADTNPERRSPQIWKAMYKYYQDNKEQFLRHYHKRSNVETTFAMIKVKLGEYLRCKKFESQRNELLMKFIVHNITCLVNEMYRNGIRVDFKKCLSEYNNPKVIEVIPEEERPKPHGLTGRLKLT